VPGLLDLTLFIVVAVGLTMYEMFVSWPRIRAALVAGDQRARMHWYNVTLAGEWAIVGCVILRWLVTHRTWTDLGIARPTPWGFWVSLGATVGVGGLLGLQARGLARRNPDRRRALVPRLGAAGLLLPHTLEEYRWFMALSVTAGVCEELFYRGFIVWTARFWIGLWGGAALSVVLFGLAHAYQGRSGAIRATLMGGVFGLLALLAHSIVPGMVLHAIVDLGAGATGYVLLRAEPMSSAGS